VGREFNPLSLALIEFYFLLFEQLAVEQSLAAGELAQSREQLIASAMPHQLEFEVAPGNKLPQLGIARTDAVDRRQPARQVVDAEALFDCARIISQKAKLYPQGFRCRHISQFLFFLVT
jgi:hypothetical protein